MSDGSAPPMLTASEAIAAVATGAATVSEVAARALERVRELDGSIGAFRIVDEELLAAQAKELDDVTAGAARSARRRQGRHRHRRPADWLRLSALRRSPAGQGRRRRRAASAGTARSCSARPSRPNSPCSNRPGPATRSTPAARPEAPRAVRPPQSPLAWSRSPSGPRRPARSIRPAAYCGVYGFKPSIGWASTAGIWCLAEHLDTVGLFARNVATSACSTASPGPARTWRRSERRPHAG